MCPNFKEKSITELDELHKLCYMDLGVNGSDVDKAVKNFFINVWSQLEDRLFPADAHPRNYKVQELLYKDKDHVLLTCLTHIISILSTGWLADAVCKHTRDEFSFKYTIEVNLSPSGMYDLYDYIRQFISRVKELLEEKDKKGKREE